MKKTLSFVMTLVILASMLTVFAFASTTITTPEQFLAIAQNPQGVYTLGADIDMSAHPLSSPLSKTFVGTLDGAGHKIKNLKITVNDASMAALFETNSGTIKNLGVSGEISAKNANGNVHAATIAIDNKGTIQNIDADVKITAFAISAQAGGIASDSKGTIKDCKVFGSINLSRSLQTVGGTFIAGGIAAQAKTISGCENNADITIGGQTSQSCTAGGIVGQNIGQSSFVYNKNSGDVTTHSTAQSFAGGICGNLINYSNIKASENYGAITANLSKGDALSGDMSTGDPNGNARSGGIAANVHTSGLINCANFGGDIKATKPEGSTAETLAGGIIGKLISGSVKSSNLFDMHKGTITADIKGKIWAFTKDSESLVNIYSANQGDTFTDKDKSKFAGFDFVNVWKMDGCPKINFDKRSDPGVIMPDLPTKTFVDVKAKDWFYEYVNYAVRHKIFTGTSESTFNPTGIMTRAQLVMIFANLEGVDTDSNNNVDAGFKDVPKNQWYTAAVKWAAENKIVEGDGTGKFNPSGLITREQMCVMIVNYIENYKNTSLKTLASAKDFKDGATISFWAKDAVNKCYRAGLVSGNEKGYFNPTNTATRAEGATLFSDFHKSYILN